MASRVGHEAIDATNHEFYAQLTVIMAFALLCCLLIMHFVDGRRRRELFWSRGVALTLLWLVGLSAIASTVLAAHTGGTAVWQRIQHETTFGSHADM